MYDQKHHSLGSFLSICRFSWGTKFDLVEKCFNLVRLFRIKVFPWFSSFAIDSNPDFIKEINKVKQNLLIAKRPIMYEIFPYDEKLSQLSSAETFLVTFFVGLFVGILLEFSVSFWINLQEIWFFPVVYFVRVLLFSTWLLFIFLISLTLAYIRFLLSEYHLKNTFYLITRLEIYFINKSWNWFNRIVTPVNVALFTIKEGVWEPTFEKSEVYDYCGIDAAIVSVYVTQKGYVESYKRRKYQLLKEQDSNITLSHIKLNKFPNDLGREAAPFYIYVVRDYINLTRRLRSWKTSSTKPKDNQSTKKSSG